MKKIIFKGASWDSMFLAFAKALTLLLSIVSAKMLSTGLTLTEYGTYSQANLVSSVGASIILLGLVDSMNFYFNNKENEIAVRIKIVNTVFFLEIFFGLIFLTAVILGQNIISGFFGNETLKVLLPIAGILPAFTNVIYFYQVLYVSIGRAKLMSLLNLASTVVYIAAIYISVYVLENILWIYVVLLLLDVAKVIVLNAALRRNGVKINPIKISPSHIKPIMAYGLPMGIYAITSSFTRDLDKLVIGRLGGTEDLAVYSNCSKLLPLDFFVSSFALVLIPYIYKRVFEGKREESIDLFSSYLKVGYYTVWTLGVMVLVAPESIISFLYADDYVQGKTVFIMYIFDSMLRFASIHLILTAAGKAKNVMLYSLISLGSNFVLNILLYNCLGMIGPAIATLIVAVLYMLLILNDTRKTISAGWAEIFDFKEIAWFVFTLFISWAFAFAVNDLFVHLEINIYLSMIISMIIFVLIIVALHFKKMLGVFKKINTYEL